MSAVAAERQLSVGPRLARAAVSLAPTILEPELSRLHLVAEEELDTSTLRREFPTLAVECVERGAEGGRVIDDFAWRGSFEFGRFDEAMESGRPIGTLVVRGGDSAGVACEVLARYQRFIARRNAASEGRVFDALLVAHASLYDVSRPLVRAEFSHSLDTLQWLLRLEPDASLPAQIAALFHDIERLDKDAQEKLEHRAPDHRASSNTQEPGATDARVRLRTLLEEAGVEDEAAGHAEEILSGSEQHAREVSILDEADALSFLSLESARYADHFGLAQTRRKVTHTVGRLSLRGRDKLSLIRLRPDVERLLRA